MPHVVTCCCLCDHGWRHGGETVFLARANLNPKYFKRPGATGGRQRKTSFLTLGEYLPRNRRAVLGPPEVQESTFPNPRAMTHLGRAMIIGGVPPFVPLASPKGDSVDHERRHQI
jgi:hypothetical protein